MKSLMIAGVVFILLGTAALIYQGVAYTDREKVVDIGPIEATAEKRKVVWIPPVLGWVAVGGGVVLLLAGMRREAVA